MQSKSAHPESMSEPAEGVEGCALLCLEPVERGRGLRLGVMASRGAAKPSPGGFKTFPYPGDHFGRLRAFVMTRVVMNTASARLSVRFAAL
ncbi:hypothetical protein [Anaerolinea sp.]|uniref:hypothetical protein n=1 Tax=Anaerolinea sp. TaxID=1872519 RepID=UPI002ACD8882|nr:hypothetical protein [Anaerolinea sp.]